MRLRRNRERRTGPRGTVVWEGRYGRLGQPEWEWQPCAVEDVSGGGARLTTEPPCAVRAGEKVGIAVERLGSTTVGIVLRGEVAHVTRATAADSTDGTVASTIAIGVALDFTTPQERRVAESLFARS